MLRRCCAELRDQIDPRGVRLAGAVVAGPLDLAGLRCRSRCGSMTASSKRRPWWSPLAWPRRILDIGYDLTVGYGYRPGRVLWLLAVLLILVTGSLQSPGARVAMRATTAAGVVFTTQGPLRSPARPVPAGTAPVPAGTASDPVPGNACGDGQVRCFNPVRYAIDTVVPLISLDQRSTWYPGARTRDGTLMEWWLNAAALLGWLLTSIFVLALASLARSL